jgi:hypothetical protein
MAAQSSSSTSSNDKPGPQTGIKGSSPKKKPTPPKKVQVLRKKSTGSLVRPTTDLPGNDTGLKGHTSGGNGGDVIFAGPDKPLTKENKPKKEKKDKKAKKDKKKEKKAEKPKKKKAKKK